MNIAFGLTVLFGGLGIMQGIYAHKTGYQAAGNIGYILIILSGISAIFVF